MNGLTETQKRAVRARNEPMAIVAAAGSGKTTVLIQRCRNIIGDDPAQLDRILAITFTEKAAAELKSRLRAGLPPRAHHRLATSWIGTFHACCARMLRQHAPLIGLDPAFAILDENAADLIMRQTVRATVLAALENRDAHVATLVDALDFNGTVGAIEELMAFRWHARRALARPTSDDNAEEEILHAAAHAYGLCEESYRNALTVEDALDFQELEMRAIELLDRHPDVRAGYHRRFRHLLIDEFQDTNDVQMELIVRLYEPGSNTLCIVGDPRQSIYRFRGANVDCFGQAIKLIRKAGGQALPLTQNFRSRRGIISFVNAAADRMADGLFGTHPDEELLTPAAEAMKAVRGDEGAGPPVVALDVGLTETLTASQRRRREALAIASFAEDLIRTQGYHPGDIVCLFQALTDTGEYEAAFRERGIPHRFFGGRGLLDRQEVCDLMHVLRYAANPSDNAALLGLLRSPLIGISDEECARLAGPDGSRLRENARAHPSCRLLPTIEGMAAHRRPSEILAAVIDETGLEWMLAELDPSGGMRATVDRLIMLAASLENQAPTTLADFIALIARLRERSARLGDPPAAGDATAALRCMTVHTAKGLEFPVVILPDLFRQEPNSNHPWIFHRREGCALKLKDTDRPFGPRRATPRYERIAEIEESEARAERARLLYVAMTRAREMLVLPLHRAEKLKGPWHEWLRPLVAHATKMSPREAGAAQTESTDDGAAPAATIETFDRNEMGFRRLHGMRAYSVSQLECYDRCPQEYYLKYVLGVPATNILAEETARLAANVRGSIAHGVLETLTPACAGELYELIRSQCLAHDVYPDDAAVALIERPIRTFMEMPLFRESESGERETRFEWLVDGDIVTGCIDWHRPTPAGIEILDFKTDDVDGAGTAARAQGYDLQMITYAAALEDARGDPVASTSLIFLAPGIVHTVPFDGARRAAGIARIDEIRQRIAADDFAIEGSPRPCYNCPYHHNGLCWKDTRSDRA